jgi:hypothetical protein
MLRILLTASLLKSGINACASLQGRLREKPQEGADIPLGRQTEQRQQVPHLDRTDLHRRCGQENQPRRAFPQAPHEPQQLIRGLIRAKPAAPASGVMRLIENQQVPRFSVLGLYRIPMNP